MICDSLLKPLQVILVVSFAGLSFFSSLHISLVLSFCIKATIEPLGIVASLRRVVKTRLLFAMTVGEVATAKAQRAYEQLRSSFRQVPLEFLDQNDIENFQALMSKVKTKINRAQEPGANCMLDWDALPAEIKNLVYEHVFKGHGIIVPILPGTRTDGEHVTTTNLGSQLLCANSTIYKQALPILLSTNIFEINKGLYRCLVPHRCLRSDRLVSYSDRLAMIKKVTIRDSDLFASKGSTFKHFRQIEQLVLYNYGAFYFTQYDDNDDDWKETTAKVQRRWAVQEGLDMALKCNAWLRNVSIRYVSRLSLGFIRRDSVTPANASKAQELLKSPWFLAHISREGIKTFEMAKLAKWDIGTTLDDSGVYPLRFVAAKDVPLGFRPSEDDLVCYAFKGN